MSRRVAALLATLVVSTSVAAAGGGSVTVLDDKNGFRDAKLGADLASLGALAEAGKRDGTQWYTREADKLTLFETKLAGVSYGFRDDKLAVIVITGAWTLDGKQSLCEGNSEHVGDNLRKVFGKPTASHAYSSSEGKRCVRDFGGGLPSPYCRVVEWKTARVRLELFSVLTTSPGPPPPDVVGKEGWSGYSCRFVLEYASVADPAAEL